MTGTTWESRLLELFEDLEQQAAGLDLVERDLEVADLGAAEYAQVGLADRLRGSCGEEVSVRLAGGLQLRGRLARSAEEWLLLTDGSAAAGWLVPLPAVVSLTGLTARAGHPGTAPVTDRLPLRALLRRVADGPEPCQVHLRDGGRVDGRVLRVGRDFVELAAGTAGAGSTVVAVAGIAAVRWTTW